MNCITIDGAIALNGSVISTTGIYKEVLLQPIFKHKMIKSFKRENKKDMLIEFLEDIDFTNYKIIDKVNVEFKNKILLIQDLSIIDDVSDSKQSDNDAEAQNIENQVDVKLDAEISQIDSTQSENNNDIDSNDDNIDKQSENNDTPIENENVMKYTLKINKGDKLRDQPAGIYDITLSKNVDYILLIAASGDRFSIKQNVENYVIKEPIKTLTAVTRKKRK